jgi:two-component system, response regulator YesN
MNMYQLLIIDDEHLIREGIRNSINWRNLEIDEVYTAVNGIDAKEKIATLSPQVIITDIKMPGMDGLQITEYAMKKNKHTKVIILSGYNEFDYAQKAVKLGAFEYLLKPSDYDELNKVIKMAVKKLKDEEKQEQELAKLKMEFTTRIKFYRQSFLKKLILSPQLNNGLRRKQLEESTSLYQIPDGGNQFLILAKIDQYDSHIQGRREEDRQLLLLRLEQRLFDYFEKILPIQYGITAFYIPLKDNLYAILVKEEQPIQDSLKIEFCENFQEVIQGLPITISFGISKSKPSLLELNRAYYEGSEALQYIFYFGNEAIISYSDLPTAFGEKNEGSYYTYIEEIQPILRALKIGDQDTCVKQLRYLFQLFEYNQEKSKTVKTISIELLSQIKTITPTNSFDEKDFPEELYLNVLSTETVIDCQHLLESMIIPLVKKIHNATKTTNKKIVQKVVDLIEQYYAEEISLTWVASKVHLNSSYVSRLLKKECGKNFTDLLTGCRMEKAKELLRNPEIKISEASEKVGILDAQYFSSKFKKYTGLTPSEYRDHFEDIFTSK